MKKNVTSLGIFLISTFSFAQVGINTSTPNPDAALDVVSTNKGILNTRIALSSTASPSPLSIHVAGMMVYNTATVSDVTPGLYYNDGTKWIKTGSGAAAGMEPWYNQTTNTEATSNTQNIYQTGNIAIQKQSNYLGTALDVEGAVRGGASQTGSVGANSAAFGFNNSAAGNMAVALGGSNQSNAVGSLTAGFGNITSSQYEIAVGRWNAITTGGTDASFVATDPVFQIGASATSATKRNAMTVLKNGNTGIGIAGTEAAAKPTEMLDVGSGNVRIRNINTVTGASTDKIVVADANGVLKTVSSSPATAPLNVTNQTGNYTATVNDDIILYTTDSSGISPILTLPTTGVPIGKKIFVSVIGGTSVQPSPAPRETATPLCYPGQGNILIYTGNATSPWSLISGY
ncbi:hypothetical protein [Chryseobacterium lathyri]|uniref:Trimeric autotransporter adhesin YadA-like head domain-containing protein n=1 Tax=Chryseobacterium lathyri TaxID=395933 RepID=A0A511YFS5_9FLAO|nr:hypothetical protein [Chryseobacterium lathyri]GEN74048.1 hypothetical protein CLA01_41200 [Chryseobacterium lathyri]